MNESPPPRGPRWDKLFRRFFILAACVLLPVSLPAAAPDTAVSLLATGTNGEGIATYQLTWEAAAQATYKIQSRTSFDSTLSWTTVDLVTPATAGPVTVTLLNPPSVSDAGFSFVPARFYRVQLPATEISRVEPSVVSAGGGQVYVLGQCFTAGQVVRVDGVNVVTEFLEVGRLRVTLPSLLAGTHRIEIFDGASGLVVATLSFGLQSVGGTPRNLTLPPEMPPARIGTNASLSLGAGPYVTDAFSAPRAGRSGSAQYAALPTGEFIVTEEDLHIPGRGFDMVWARTYRSRTGTNTAQGQGWDSSYNIRVEPLGPDVELFEGNGRHYTLRGQQDGTFVADGLFREGSNSNGAFSLRFSDGGHWNFHAWNVGLLAGKLRQIIDRNGNTMNFTYDAQARLGEVIDTLGRTNRVGYGADGRIQSFTDFSGRQVRYAYYGQGEPGGSPGDLKAAVSPAVIGTPNGNDFPGGKTNAYTYSAGFADERLNHNLRSITDPLGQAWLRVDYHPVLTPDHADFDAVATMFRGVDRKDIRRVTLVPSADNAFAVVKAIVNDPMGNVGEYFYDSRNRLLLRREYSGRALPNQPTTDVDNRPAGRLRASDPAYFETRYEWNPGSLLVRLTRPRGNVTEWHYEGDFDPSTPARMKGNLRVERQISCCGMTDVVGDGAAVVVVTRHEHDPRFGSEGGAEFATKTTDARGHSTLRWFDGSGNLTRLQHPLPGVVEDFGCNPYGQMTAHDWPPAAGGCRRRDTFEYASDPAARDFGHLKKKTRDDGGLPCGQTGPLRLATSFEYDAVGNITAVMDPRGATNRLVYNALDQLVLRTRTCRPVGGTAGFEITEDFSYDANDNLLVWRFENRDENGALDSHNPYLLQAFEYDSLNRLLRKTRSGTVGGGATTEYGYDGNGNLNRVRQPEAVSGADPHNVVQYEYDERNLLFRKLRAPLSTLRSTQQRDYDLNGHVNVQKDWDVNDALSRVTRSFYDGLDRLASVRDPLGNTTSNRYDLKGNLTLRRQDGNYSEAPPPATSSGRLAQSLFFHDPLDRPIRVVEEFFDPATGQPFGDGGRTTQTAYALDGQVQSVTDDNGFITRYFHDGAGRLLAVQDPKTNTVTYARDGNDNVTTMTQVDRSDVAEAAQVFVSQYQYDTLNRLGRKIDGMTNVTRYGHDSRDNLVLQVDARGHLTRHEYDSLGRRVRTGRDLNGDLNPFGEEDIVTQQGWDANSRLRSQTDDHVNPTQYDYDSLDRLARTTFADGTIETNAYDSHDNLLFKRDANGTAINHTCDLLNRLTARTIVAGFGVGTDITSESYRYDGLSRLIRAQDNDSVVTREYDSLGHLRRDTVNGLVTSSTYDGVGNRLSLSYPGGRTVEYTYDALNRAKIVRDNTGGVPADLATYQYIGPDRVTRRDNGNGIRSRFTYDGVQGVPNAPGDFGVRRLSRVRHAASGAATILDERTFTWDRTQNKTLRSDVRAGGPGLKHSYLYDAANRMTLAEVRDAFFLFRSSPYPMDGVGNRAPEQAGLAPWDMNSAMPDPGDYQMNQYTSTDFDVRSYDANGNTLVTLLTLQWVWLPSRLITVDYRNQIVSIVDPFTGATVSHRYDALGRRFRKTEVTAGGESTVATDYAYAEQSMIEERQTGGVSASYVIVPQGTLEVLSMSRGGHRYFYHEDDLGNVMALSDEHGALAERYEYLEYGEPQFYDAEGNLWLSSQLENHVLFRGLRYDDESGFYGCGGRYLDSQVGRFVSRDPRGAWSDPRSFGNAFTYAGNNPWTLSDGRPPVTTATTGRAAGRWSLRLPFSTEE